MESPIHTEPEIFNFIHEHENDNTASLLLKLHKHPGLPLKFIAGQIESRKKAKSKLPEWHAGREIIFPPRQNLEQASSQITAQFKARFISGTRLADLAGGTGVDTFYLAKKFKHAVSVEPDKYLSAVSRHNFGVLDAPHIEVLNMSAEEFLDKNNTHFDWIYADPSRRNNAGSKVTAFEESAPDILTLKSTILSYTEHLLIKASPMLDIKKAIKQLENCFKVQILAVANEVKELLFYVGPDAADDPVIEAYNLAGKEEVFRFRYSGERDAEAEYALPKTYLYKPNAALMKAGPYKLLASAFGLEKIHPGTHLYTSDRLADDFPGRIYRIKEMFKPSKKEVKKHSNGGKINVIARNFPEGANALKKVHRLADGGDRYLIFTTIAGNAHKVLLCEREK